MARAKDVPFAVSLRHGSPLASGAASGSGNSEGLPGSPGWASTLPCPSMSNSGEPSGQGRDRRAWSGEAAWVPQGLRVMASSVVRHSCDPERHHDP